MRRLHLPALLGLLALSCASGGRGEPAAHSLFGEPLYAPSLTDERRSELEADLAVAIADRETRPHDEDAIIWHGRRLAYLGRYEEAIGVFTEGLRHHPNSYKLLRHRGHRWITLRKFDLAVLDLRRAAELATDLEDEVEPDGAPNEYGIPRSTLKTNIWYHLGLAHYLDGQLADALRIYQVCRQLSEINDDMLCATSHWLFMTLRRLGRDEEARAVLDPIHEDMEILENFGYHRLLLMYRGELEPTDLYDPEAEDSIENATVAYGVANWFFCNGDVERGAALFHDIVGGSSWPAFGHIAAEADLARLGPFLPDSE